MFDNTKPNVIILSDKTTAMYMEKTLGPYKVAQVLRSHGYQVAVIHHVSIFSWSELEHTLRHMISDQTLFVGINNFFYSIVSSPTFLNPYSEDANVVDSNLLLPHGYEYNDKLKSLIKDLNPKCKLVLGGPNAVDTQTNKIYDYVVSGYSEMSIVELANHLNDGAKLSKSYKSIFGPVILTDLKADGYDFSKCDMRYQDSDAILPGETLVIEVARGCIFKCSFCAFPLNGKKKMDYVRDFDLLRGELIDNYERFGVTRYILSDDTINDSVEKCQMLAELGDSLPFELEWHGYIRLDLLMAHPETVDMLYRGGMRSVFFGIETFNSKTAKAINKAGNKEKQVEFARGIKERYGDKVALHGNFICGLPHESVSSMTDTVEFLLSEDSPFTTWVVIPLSLKPKTAQDNYYSEFDLNYEKHGYTDLGISDAPRSKFNAYKSNYINWQNEHMNLELAQRLCVRFEAKRMSDPNVKVHGRVSFDEASMNGVLELNKINRTVDIYDLNCKKMNRVRLYKKTFWEHNGVPHFEEQHPVEKFTDWLQLANGITYSREREHRMLTKRKI